MNEYVVILKIILTTPLERMTIEEFLQEQWEQTPASSEGDILKVIASVQKVG